MSGGTCGTGTCPLLTQTGGNRIGIMNPRYGGSNTRKTQKNQKQKGRGCGCSEKQPMMPLPPGLQPSRNLTGGACGCTRLHIPIRTAGGACPCQAAPQGPVPLEGFGKPMGGGTYRPTKRNLKYLKKWKRGESIGFTMRSSLKAKGLIPRANGTYKVSPKYQTRK